MQPKHGMSALLIVLLFSLNGFSQVRISGFVADSISGERLIGANVTQKGTTIGYTTDHNGYFSFVADVTAKFKVSYTGYSSVDFVACLHKDSLFQISLSPGKTLSAVTVRAPVHTRPNVTRLGIAELTAIPSLSGKPDVIKAMQMLPGIKTQSEGSSLLLVRGGNPGESLYLLDKTPLIYVNHLGGFMSVFNPDIINSIEIFKAGFPARYGGKLSSVLDITQKEGSAAGARAAYSIGITDVSLLLEGPINNKLTYIFSGRKTLFDLLMMAGTRLSNANRFIMGYGFHDLNGKLSWKPDAHNSLHLNIYQGDDYLNYWSRKDKLNPENKNKKTSVWGNWLVAANWKHVISPRLFSEQIISYTRYRLTERQKFIYKSVSGL